MTTAHRYIVVEQWAGGAAVAVASCPACASSSRSLHASAVVDHLNPVGVDLWTVWRCCACRSLYPDPRPSDESIGFAYANYYTHDAEIDVGGHKGVIGFVGALVNGYMNRRFSAAMKPEISFGFALFNLVEPLRLKLDYHGRHLFLAAKSAGRRLLDVGSGNGEFLLRAQQLGWDASGIDPDVEAVNACRAQGLKAWQGFISDEVSDCAEPYDVITLRHSIEHVPDPQADLQCCYDKLHPGGMLWLAWPNPCGPGASIFKAAWRGLEMPRHLCIPSARAMRSMLEHKGFVGVRLLRRGHHARSIAKASAALAAQRPGVINRVRGGLAILDGYWADLAATLSSAWGEELVMVAYKPLKDRHDA